jgi:hypothetical protein
VALEADATVETTLVRDALQTLPIGPGSRDDDLERGLDRRRDSRVAAADG